MMARGARGSCGPMYVHQQSDYRAETTGMHLRMVYLLGRGAEEGGPSAHDHEVEVPPTTRGDARIHRRYLLRSGKY